MPSSIRATPRRTKPSPKARAWAAADELLNHLTLYGAQNDVGPTIRQMRAQMERLEQMKFTAPQILAIAEALLGAWAVGRDSGRSLGELAASLEKEESQA